MTGRAVGANHKVRTQLSAISGLEAIEPSVGFQRPVSPAGEQDGARFNCCILQRGVERDTGDCYSMPRVGMTSRGRQSDPSPGGPDNDHVTDVEPTRKRVADIGQHLYATGPDQIAARLVTGEVFAIARKALSDALSNSATRAPWRASVSAAKLPAGPDPTISTSKRTLLTELSADGRGSSLHHWDRHKPASTELELLEQISRRAQIDGDGLRGCPDWRGTRLERGCER